MSASNESFRRDSSADGRNRNRNRNRSRNRNRNRDRDREGHSDQGRDRNRNRNRNRNRRPRVELRKPTLVEKILTFVTFGLYEPDLVVRNRSSARSSDEASSTQEPEASISQPRQEQKPRRERETESSSERERPARDRDRERDRDRDRERERRPPEPAEVTSERLYVGNLDYETTEADLYDLFNGVGKVKDAEVVCHKYTQRSKGYAFVIMSTVEEAKRAVAVLNNKQFMGRELWVSGAKSTGPKDLEASGSEEASSSETPAPAAETAPAEEEVGSREAVA